MSSIFLTLGASDSVTSGVSSLTLECLRNVLGSHVFNVNPKLLSLRAAEKRHADGTFTSDVSSYLKDQAIKDFVARLKSGKVRRE